jgi:hypothetical protein
MLALRIRVIWIARLSRSRRRQGKPDFITLYADGKLPAELLLSFLLLASVLWVHPPRNDRLPSHRFRDVPSQRHDGNHRIHTRRSRE